MTRAAWFCPSCQKYHAPHCDTCPMPAIAAPLPRVTAPYIVPTWQPYIPDLTPALPIYPIVTCVNGTGLQ